MTIGRLYYKVAFYGAMVLRLHTCLLLLSCVMQKRDYLEYNDSTYGLSILPIEYIDNP